MFNLNLIEPLALSSSLWKLQELEKEGRRRSQGTKQFNIASHKVEMLQDN